LEDETLHNTRNITENIIWIGASDRRIERFENLFPLSHGIAYNSYLILDEKTALLDTVDGSITDQFLENVNHTLAGRTLDYLIVNHMEPDHCANIEALVRRYPQVKLVGNKKTFQFFNQYYTLDITENQYLVSENDEISLGKHVLQFHLAPMVHWPEVMFTYEKSEHILFSADAFGTFGALSGNLFADEIDFDRYFLDEARRYYANIVGKYGAQVQAVFSKLPLSEINMICPLHGPVWREQVSSIIEKYQLWSTYTPEKKGVVLAYASMYGNTENAVQKLASLLAVRGVKDLRMYDVSKTDLSYIVSDVWKYSHLVTASPTYNLHLYAKMANVLEDLAALNMRNRKVAILGNYTWASAAKKGMETIFSSMQNMEVLGSYDIKSSPKDEDLAYLETLSDTIAASVFEEPQQ